MDPDPGGPKPCGSYGFGSESATLLPLPSLHLPYSNMGDPVLGLHADDVIAGLTLPHQGGFTY
jgi:hypothetical protein